MHPKTRIVEYILKYHLQMLTLQVTQNCNLRCEYCVYSGGYLQREHQERNMSFEVAKKALDFLLEHSQDSSKLNVGFYGGEPLMNIDLIKKVVAYMKQEAEGKTVEYNITTNGTLLNEEIVKFLVENNFHIMISLDGPRSIHDEYRKFFHSEKGSFDILMKNVKRIKQVYAEYFSKNVCFNTVLNPNRGFKCIGDYIQGESLFKDSYFSSSLLSENYKEEDNVISEEFIKEYSYEIFKVFLYKLGYLEEKHISHIFKDYFDSLMRNYEMKEFFKREELPNAWHHGGPCVPGGLRAFVSVDGELFPCERVSETSKVARIGDLDNGFDMKQIYSLLNLEEITEEKCHNCWAYEHCSVCVACADDTKKLSRERIFKRCPIVQQTFENELKDYSVLKTLGYDFDKGL